jgi:hypothetical protein
VTQFWDRQLDDRISQRRRNQREASRRSKLARKCPKCNHLGALKRTLDDDGSLRLVCLRAQCDYQRVVPLEQLRSFALRPTPADL